MAGETDGRLTNCGGRVRREEKRIEKKKEKKRKREGGHRGTKA